MFRKTIKMFNLFPKKSPISLQATQYLDFAELLSRQKYPYAQGWVNDDFNGRFEMLAVFLGMLYAKLHLHEDKNQFAQEFADLLVLKLDENLRLNGVSDVRVGKKVKEWAKKLFGRIAVYHHCFITENSALLGDALERNGDIRAKNNADLAAYLWQEYAKMQLP